MIILFIWINYVCIAVSSNLKMKHQECAARVEKLHCRNYTQHPNQYQLWYYLAQANRKYLGKYKHANIQSTSVNLSSFWITTTTTGCRSQISSNLFHGKHWWINQRPDSITALNDKLSLHYKLYSINTTNEFKRLQFPVLLTFAMTINKARGQ